MKKVFIFIIICVSTISSLQWIFFTLTSYKKSDKKKSSVNNLNI